MVIDDRPDLVWWRQGRCLSYGDGIALWALGEIIKAQAGILDSDDATTAGEKLGRTVDLLFDDQATAAGLESAWWYFGLGRVARFLDGRLLEVESYPPVPARSGEAP